jgi:hypothetical protein
MQDQIKNKRWTILFFAAGKVAVFFFQMCLG